MKFLWLLIAASALAQTSTVCNSTPGTLTSCVTIKSGPPGVKGDKGDPSTVPGPKGDKGDPSTVPGPQGPPGPDIAGLSSDGNNGIIVKGSASFLPAQPAAINGRCSITAPPVVADFVLWVRCSDHKLICTWSDHSSCN